MYSFDSSKFFVIIKITIFAPVIFPSHKKYLLLMSSRLKGVLCGVGAAVSYGMNPLGALPLYSYGINTNSVLFYRYGLAVILLGIFMAMGRKSFSITLKEFAVLVPLGILFALSSLTLFASFHFMDAGVASTLLFVYPVMVAVIMAMFFKERITFVTVVSILLSLSGIALLYRGGDGGVLNTTGVLLVMLSSLTYALYIVVVNKSSLRVSSVKLTFYVLLVGVLLIVSCSLLGSNESKIQLLTTPGMWLHASILAVFPTIVSLLLMVVAVHEIGSTPTAVLGALEPLTAVILGVTLFGERLTVGLSVGIMLILSAVVLIVLGNSISLNRITMVAGRFGHLLAKHWRWK